MFQCACGGDYVRSQFRDKSRFAVCQDAGGWRPLPTKVFEEKHPLVLNLLRECWRSEQTKVNADATEPPRLLHHQGGERDDRRHDHSRGDGRAGVHVRCARSYRWLVFVGGPEVTRTTHACLRYQVP